MLRTGGSALLVRATRPMFVVSTRLVARPTTTPTTVMVSALGSALRGGDTVVSKSNRPARQ